MKKLVTLPVLALLVSFPLFIMGQTNESYQEEITKSRRDKDQFMANTRMSPLEAEQLTKFDSLSYFPVDTKYRFEGQFNANDGNQKVNLNTTSGKQKELKRVGSVTFTFEGEDYTLSIFENDNLPEFGDDNQQLFIPFIDLTSGEQTSSIGRYVPVRLTEGETAVVIDFNEAINPFSEYNNSIVSVVSPPSNKLMFNVVSGERKYEHR